MTDPGTAVALPEAPSDAAIQAFRKAGAATAAFERERNALVRMIEGHQFGTVSGAGLSPHTRTMIANCCITMRADPLTHLDILGGKAYFNAAYSFTVMLAHPYYISYWQRSITAETEAGLRKLGMDDKADEIAEARLNYCPPSRATAVVETIIRRYQNSAPLAAIRRGDLSHEEAEKWVIEVRDCNWAGGKQGDPVGNAESEKSAATRSARRTINRAFSGWMKQYEEQITKAEEALEADWEYANEVPVPSATGPQAVLGSGEPEAGNVAKAKALPVRGEAAPKIIEGDVIEDQDEAEAEPEPVPAWDPTDARKRLFATLRDCGIAEKKRKAWAKKNGLPESTSQWGKDEYERALAILVDPLREKVAAGCATLGVTVSDLSLQVLGKELPDFAKDYLALIQVLAVRLETQDDDSEDEGDEEDAGL